MGKYVFLPYDSSYPRLALEEMLRLRQGLAKTVEMEHVGSTAVPGLSGKGIIDLAIVSHDVDEAIGKLEALGFVHKTHADDPGKRWFLMRSPDEKGPVFHLHLMNRVTGEFAAMVAFRDYLRVHPEAVKAYSICKRLGKAAASKARGKEAKKRAYMLEKADFIQGILKAIGVKVAGGLQ